MPFSGRKEDTHNNGRSELPILLSRGQNDDVLYLHRPHPDNEMAKRGVASLRRFLDQLEIGTE